MAEANVTFESSYRVLCYPYVMSYEPVVNQPAVYQATHDQAEADPNHLVINGNSGQAGQFYTGSGESYHVWTIRRTFLYFDTSSIPDDAVINTAKIRVYLTIKNITLNNFDVVIQNGQPTYPHNPWENEDINHVNYSGNGGSKNTVDMTVSQDIDIDLNDTGKSWINLEGYTKLILRSSRDISSTPPTVATEEEQKIYEYVQFEIGPSGKYAELIVNYTYTAEPTVTIQAVTDIDYDYAKGNGTIVSGSDITERGFEVRLDYGAYKDSQDGSLGGYVFHSVAGFDGTVTFDLVYQWNGVLTKTITEEGSFETGAFTGNLAKQPYPMFNNTLFKCESYTCRAYATNDIGTGYSDYVAFDTLCDAGGEQQPTDDISEGNPTVPIIPIESEPEIPPFEWDPEEPEPFPPWDWDLPDWEMPDYPPMSFVGDFYYRKPYTKKDLDDLRRKCIIYNKNSVEFALVLRHNMNVLREFFNMMTDYMGKEEFNDFTDLIPPQNLKELYLDPLDPADFRDMINGFIRNTIDNNMAVNRNFKLIQDGLSDYETESDDAYFKEINSNIKTVTGDDPDVHRLKSKIDSLNQEVASNFGSIMRNLKIVRARLL